MRAAEGVPARTGPVPVLRSRTACPEPTGMRRPRLQRLLVGPAAPHLAAVVAGPGCGKTTLLAQVADAARLPVAWLTLDAALDPAALLAHLHLACRHLPWRTPPGPWESVDEAVAALGDGLVGSALLVLDDVHTTERRRTAHVVDALLRHQPAELRVVLASRCTPSGVPSRELAGTARVLDARTLRFRTWEVEELFRGHHGVPLRAGEAVELTRRTDGWAAGLELFHLATRDRPSSSRTRGLERAGRGPAVAEYLAGHVLDQLPAAVRELLVRTSVLRHLSAQRCDTLLGTTTSARLLATAHRHGLLTTVDDADGTRYECHGVVRAHLLDVLTERAGGAVARELHRRAAALALAAGEHDDAVLSSCHAQDWEAVRQVLAVGGADLARRPGAWLDLLPDAIRDADPSVALAVARRHLVEGALDAALDAYAVAEERAPAGPARARVGDERRQLGTWVGAPDAATGWVAQVRDALVRPRDVLGTPHPHGVGGLLAVAVAALVGGDVHDAARRFAAVQPRAAAYPAVEAVALLGQAVCLTLVHDRTSPEARDRARTAAELVGAPVLERLATGLDLAARPATAPGGLRHLRERCVDLGDVWGAALLGLLGVLGSLGGAAGARTGGADARAALDVAADLESLGAPALAAWAHGAAAVLGARGRPDGAADVTASCGPVPLALTLLARGAARERWLRAAQEGGVEAWLRHVAARWGPSGAGPSPDAAPGATLLAAEVLGSDRSSADAPTLHVRCLGDFRLGVDGATVPVSSLRPQHAALLRALALHAPAPVHRDRLVEWFWPARLPERGQHSLQVAVSDVRRVLDLARPGGGALLRRAERGYALGLEGRTVHDVRRLEQVLRAADLALAAGDEDGAVAALQDAVTNGAAELLAQDGSAEWVLPARERVRDGVVRACATVGDLLAARGDHAGAVAAARRGLTVDRFQDDLWRRLVHVLLADGRPAAAAAAQREYAAVLRELGVAAPPVRRAATITAP